MGAKGPGNAIRLAMPGVFVSSYASAISATV